MFSYNLWMGCLAAPRYHMPIILSSYQYCDEQQFQTLIINIKYQIYIALISNKRSEALKSIDVIIMCTIHNLSGNKARFSHTSTVTKLHSCPGKKIRVLLAYILFYIEINVFEHF